MRIKTLPVVVFFGLIFSALNMSHASPNILPSCNFKEELVIKKANVMIDYKATLSAPYLSLKFEYLPNRKYPECAMVFGNDSYSLTADIDLVQLSVNKEKSSKNLMNVEYTESYVTGGGWLYRTGSKVIVFVPDKKTEEIWGRALQYARDWNIFHLSRLLPEIVTIPLNR